MVITVVTGTDPVANMAALQAAVNSAVGGDEVAAPVATYDGTLVLPTKIISAAAVIVRPVSFVGLPLAGTRIDPSHAVFMPKIRVLVNNAPGIRTCLPANGVANGYVIQCFEVEANAFAGGNLVELGNTNNQLSNKQDTLAKVPANLTLDRCYIHGTPFNGQKRGISLDGNHILVTECYISDCWSIGQDSQAISGFNGIGDYTVTNSYLEGSTENFLMGGSDPLIPNLVPTGLVFTRNDVEKPLAWRSPILSTPTGVMGSPTTGGTLPAGTYNYQVVAQRTSYQNNVARSTASSVVSVAVSPPDCAVTLTWNPVAGAQRYLVYRNGGLFFTVTGTTSFVDIGDPGTAGSIPTTPGTVRQVKNLLELKNFDTARIQGNRFTRTWRQAQDGYAILFTPANQNGGNNATAVRNVLFKCNWVRSAAGGFQITAHDSGGNHHVSQRTDGITIEGNLFTDLGSFWSSGSEVGRDFLIGTDDTGTNPREGVSRLTINHNTFIWSNGATRGFLYFYGFSQATGQYDALLSFVYTNNLTIRGTFGLFGANINEGLSCLTAYCPGFNYQKNAAAGTNVNLYPPNNFHPTLTFWQAQFTSYGGSAVDDYRILPGSPYEDAGTDGLDLGAMIDCINASYAGSAPPQTCTFTVSPPVLNVTSTAQVGTADVTTQGGCAWTAASNDGWITITAGASGTGNGTVVFDIAANTGIARLGTLTIAGSTVTVAQDAVPVACTYSATPLTFTSPDTGDTGLTVDVVTQPGCAWTAVSNDSWLTVTGGSSGTGSGTVTFDVDPNVGTSSRTGTLTVAGYTVTVTQAGTVCTYSTVLSDTAVQPAAGSTITATITTSSGCAWTASSNDAWLTLSASSGTDSGTVDITVAANALFTQRSGTVVIAGTLFTITQAAAIAPPPVCTFSVAPTTLAPTATGGTYSVTITASDPACAWVAVANDLWLGVTASFGSGSGSVGIIVASHSDTSPRTGTVTVAGEVITVTQAAAGCAYQVTPTGFQVSAAGRSDTISVLTQASCAWTAVSNDGWITVTAGDSGTGSGIVSFTVAPNTGATRIGTLTVAGQTVMVRQLRQGVPPPVFLPTDPRPLPSQFTDPDDYLDALAAWYAANIRSLLQEPKVCLQWSDDGGHTWSHEHWIGVGRLGQYKKRAIWHRLGSSRDRTYRVVMSDPWPWRLLDGYMRVTEGSE